jgi:hypothetical protein
MDIVNYNLRHGWLCCGGAFVFPTFIKDENRTIVVIAQCLVKEDNGLVDAYE